MPKIKTPTIRQLHRKLWPLFSLYIRQRDAKRDELLYDGELAMCITCGKPYPPTGKGCLQAGHFIGGRNNQVLYDERQVYAQCYNCNINLRGNWPAYLKKMKELWGDDVVQEMLDTHNQPRKYTVSELEALIEHYKALVKEA
jgi:hypothetical protein